MENEIREMILETLWTAASELRCDEGHGLIAGDEEVERIRRFEDDGLLTRDEGFTITLASGAEFQVTIKRSR